jgi:hypothetical protein
MSIDKKQWFDVLDSRVEREDGKGFYYNVEARFSDHPVINIEKSRIARHNVYEFSVVLHTRVKRAAGDVPAVKNMTSQPIRFDKAKLSQEQFNEAVKLIARCYDAWLHYQKFREAPVTSGEEKALLQLNQMPAAAIKSKKGKPATVMVDIGGDLVERQLAGADEDEDADEHAGATFDATTSGRPHSRGKPRRPKISA